MGRTQANARHSRRGSCHIRQPRSFAMPPGPVRRHRHRRRPAIGTMSPAITVTTAVRPPTVASVSSRAAVARVPGRSTSAASEHCAVARVLPSMNAVVAGVAVTVDTGAKPNPPASGPTNNQQTNKRRGGIAPVAPQPCARWSRAESAPMPGHKRQPSGRSQRGDSAWYKTLDHLLSLLMETAI